MIICYDKNNKFLKQYDPKVKPTNNLFTKEQNKILVIRDLEVRNNTERIVFNSKESVIVLAEAFNCLPEHTITIEGDIEFNHQNAHFIVNNLKW